MSERPFGELSRWSEARGLNLVGIVDAPAFDAAQPSGRRAKDLAAGCESILVLGSGGRGCWDHLRSTLGSQLDVPQEGRHPIDDWSGRVARELLAELGVSGKVVLPNDDPSLNFVQLAEIAGLGSVSPVIHQLLHPDFGPWVSLRAALLLDGKPFGQPEPMVTASFQPCDGCSRPCVDACPASVYSATEPPRFAACAEHRLADGCGEGCDVRHACRLGAAHRYSADEERFRHAHSTFVMRRRQTGASPGLFRRMAAVLRFRR